MNNQKKIGQIFADKEQFFKSVNIRSIYALQEEYGSMPIFFEIFGFLLDRGWTIGVPVDDLIKKQ